jgi:hypothetical protein
MTKSDDDRDAAQGIRRRRLLRGAGTVVAAAAGVGAIGAMANTAAAADGDPVTIGAANTGGPNSTRLTAGSAANPTLVLDNSASGGAPLALHPMTGAEWPSDSAPVGSVYADDWGDFYGIGQPGGVGSKYTNLLYSPTWATMVIPISPIRYLDTRVASLRQFVVPGSATFDSAGRVVPKNSNTVPDLVLDLSPILLGGRAAVQANFTALQPLAQGFASLWDQGPWPGTSSINYIPSVPEIANFTQTVVGSDMRIRLKTQRACQFIIDIVGVVVSDPFSQLNPSFGGSAAAAAAGANRPLWERQRPPQR